MQFANLVLSGAVSQGSGGGEGEASLQTQVGINEICNPRFTIIYIHIVAVQAKFECL